MYKALVFFLSLALLFSGCYKVNKDEVKKPANLIPKAKMVDILTDMEIIEGAAVYNKNHYPGYKSIEKSYYRLLLDHYHVTKEQIKASMDYYNSQGNEMAKIYDKVMAKLAEKQTILNMEQRKRENEKFHLGTPAQEFPFLFRENSLSNLCINPII